MRQYLPLVSIMLISVPQLTADKGPGLLRGDPSTHLPYYLPQILSSHLFAA